MSREALRVQCVLWAAPALRIRNVGLAVHSAAAARELVRVDVGRGISREERFGDGV